LSSPFERLAFHSTSNPTERGKEELRGGGEELRGGGEEEEEEELNTDDEDDANDESVSVVIGGSLYITRRIHRFTAIISFV